MGITINGEIRTRGIASALRIWQRPFGECGKKRLVGLSTRKGGSMGTVATESRTDKQTGSKPLSAREKELREAIERVYRRYGTDLPAFYRDVQKELQKRAG
jgi:hypothetical protein